jgi:hypothetical protein
MRDRRERKEREMRDRRERKEREMRDRSSVIKLLDFLLPGKSIIYFSYYSGTRVLE